MELKHPSRPDLESLLAIFYAQGERVGQFRSVSSDETPPPYRDLLSHDHHMTVAVESFHSTAVDVDVLSIVRGRGKYCRLILLRRQPDRVVVQFGIVRLNLAVIVPDVREQIEEAQLPLGRVLIQNNVMREVELHQLYEVSCGSDLAKFFDVPEGSKTFGRTALIYCDGEPAVELLEVVAPSSVMKEKDSR